MRDIDEPDSEGTKRQNIEVWNDLVSPRDLLISLAVAVVCAGAAVGLAGGFGGKVLFWGLGASVVGFALNCFLVTPKREISIVDAIDTVDGEAESDAGTDTADEVDDSEEDAK